MPVGPTCSEAKHLFPVDMCTYNNTTCIRCQPHRHTWSRHTNTDSTTSLSCTGWRSVGKNIYIHMCTMKAPPAAGLPQSPQLLAPTSTSPQCYCLSLIACSHIHPALPDSHGPSAAGHGLEDTHTDTYIHTPVCHTPKRPTDPVVYLAIGWDTPGPSDSQLHYGLILRDLLSYWQLHLLANYSSLISNSTYILSFTPVLVPVTDGQTPKQTSKLFRCDCLFLSLHPSIFPQLLLPKWSRSLPAPILFPPLRKTNKYCATHKCFSPASCNVQKVLWCWIILMACIMNKWPELFFSLLFFSWS